MKPLPKFTAPEPRDGEEISAWHRRIGDEIERFVNDELAPTIAENAKPPAPAATQPRKEPGRK